MMSLHPASQAIKKLFDDIKASGGKKYIVLLVRPQGIDSFERCMAMAEKEKMPDGKKMPLGKDALLAGGKVIFTLGGKPIVTSEPEEGRP